MNQAYLLDGEREAYNIEGVNLNPDVLNDSEMIASLMGGAAMSLQVAVRPRRRSENDNGVAEVGWCVLEPTVMKFYAQDRPTWFHPSIKEFLYRHMFYVPGAPPESTGNLAVDLGVRRLPRPAE